MPYLTQPFKDRSARLCLLSALALGTACGDDVTPSTGGDDSTGDGTTTDSPTTSGTPDPTSTTNPTTGDGSSSTTTSDDTTGEPTSSTSVGDTEDSDASTTMVDPTEDTSSTTSDESSSSTTTGDPPAMECPYGTLNAPDVLNTTTLDQDSEFTNSCGGGGAPDVSYTLTAPADGTYFFTANSPGGAITPLVAVYDGVCGGAELDCNLAPNGAGTAEVSVALTAGQEVTVVLDGFALAGGAIDLEVTFFAGTCPDDDIGNAVPAVFNGTTVGTDNTVFASCGGNTANDDQLTFTAPTDGVYVFDTSGSDFDTVLALLDGCGGDELGCSDNVLSDETSHLNLTMTAGQEVIAVVDGANLEEGNYTVTVDRDTCPDVTLDSMTPITFEGTTTGELDAASGSCGGEGAPDVSFSFTAPEAGVYTIDTSGSEFDTVLYTINSCGGDELACNDEGGIDSTSRINVTLAADEEIFFVVDGANGESGNYDVNVAFDECPDFDLGALPTTVMGNTDLETDASSGSCGPGDSPDVAYTFTAPADGTYVFDTNGSDFDTVLYYFDGATCAGTEVECDDDGGDGLDSQLIIDMVTDQEITLIIDGRFGGSGNYVLNGQQVVCGDGIVGLGEDCDGDAIPDTCFSLGEGGGQLACDASCNYDTTACGDDCGNGVIDAGEDCDLGEIGGATCQANGFDGGPIGCAADCTIDTSECADGIVVVCNSPAAAIDSAFPTTTDTITIPDMGAIADVDVFLDITHTFPADLDITLLADGLGLQNELTTDNCLSTDDVFATFNDEGDFAVGGACIAPIGIEGNLIPEAPMSVYDGSEVNGDWTLSITDDAGGDVGTLNEWCLFITLE